MSGKRNLEGLKAQMLECIEATYDKGYESGLKDGNINDGTFAAKVKEAYNNGLSDAEKAIKRVLNEPSKGGLYANELQEIFGTKGIVTVLLTHSVSEIIGKIREYDNKKAERNASPDDELHIGDEVYALDESKRKTVTAIDGNVVIVLGASGKYGTFNISELHKTGRRFVIDEILRELKGE